MQNNVINQTIELNDRHQENGEQNTSTHNLGACRVRIYRTWFFWGFVLLPMLVVFGWTQYSLVKGPVTWLGIGDTHNPAHYDWMRYYIWLQLVWLPANMMIFMIWCALGVRIWNCKRISRGH